MVRATLSFLRKPEPPDDVESMASTPTSAIVKRARRDEDKSAPSSCTNFDDNTDDQNLPISSTSGTESGDPDNAKHNSASSVPPHEATSRTNIADSAIELGAVTGPETKGNNGEGNDEDAAAGVGLYQSVRGEAWKEKKRLKLEEQRLKQGNAGKATKKKRKGNGRSFDHARWRRRTVAIQLMYEGENYAGFCSQVEHHCCLGYFAFDNVSCLRLRLYWKYLLPCHGVAGRDAFNLFLYSGSLTYDARAALHLLRVSHTA